MIGRCQLCGRRQATRRDGTIRLHHVAGVPCAGAGAVPLELDDGRLAAELATVAEQATRLYDELQALRARRANWIDPRIGERLAVLVDRSGRLARRLRRHRTWPARYRRQMERVGYALPPPAYLLDREGTEQ